MAETVEVIGIVEHPMSSFHDLFLLQVICPFCSERHHHSAVYCDRGKILDPEMLEGIYGPATSNCHKGQYFINLPGASTIQDMISKS